MTNLLISEQDIAGRIDQTNLKPQATRQEMEAFLRTARQNKFATAAILPLWTPLAADGLAGSQVAVDPAVGFPFGTSSTAQKVAETRWCIKNGGSLVEIDMVMNLSQFKSGRFTDVEQDIRAVVAAAEGRPVKVIIETPLLSQDEIAIASLLVVQGGAQYVKTSTGFRSIRGLRPCSVEDVHLIRSAVGVHARIKASGGITCIEQALAVISAGADRIGTAFGIDILNGYRKLLS